MKRWHLIPKFAIRYTNALQDYIVYWCRKCLRHHFCFVGSFFQKSELFREVRKVVENLIFAISHLYDAIARLVSSLHLIFNVQGHYEQRYDFG